MITLKDAAGRIIQRQETYSDGTIRAYSPSGAWIGTYNPKTNITQDGAGRVVGRGNLLASLR